MLCSTTYHSSVYTVLLMYGGIYIDVSESKLHLNYSLGYTATARVDPQALETQPNPKVPALAPTFRRYAAATRCPRNLYFRTRAWMVRYRSPRRTRLPEHPPSLGAQHNIRRGRLASHPGNPPPPAIAYADRPQRPGHAPHKKARCCEEKEGALQDAAA